MAEILSSRMQFVDVVVPLALPKLLTYGIQRDAVVQGSRVVVPIGKKKSYTAVVLRVHDEAPTDYEARPVESVIDERPVVTPEQLTLWAWLAGYYMCSLGEVMMAGMPTGLKLASKTRLMVHPDVLEGGVNPRVSHPRDASGHRLLDAMELNESMTLRDVARLLDVTHPQSVVNRALRRGWILTEEDWNARLIEKRAPHVKADWTDEEWGDLLDERERRAPKQAQAILAYLAIIQERSEGDEGWVLRKHLCAQAGVSTGIVQALVEKNILDAADRVLRAGTAAGAEKKEDAKRQALPELSEEQHSAREAIRSAERPILLHGVTSSGKTEVYAHVIADALERGGQAVMLVPEIALTLQLIERLETYFVGLVSVYHSRFTARQRTATWYEVLEGKPRLIIGPRSAIFLPFRNLGVVIVDESHDASYKQQEPSPRYHARDAAFQVARAFGAKLVLGTATPSVESQWAVETGRLDLVQMKRRYGGVMLPEIHSADLREAHKKGQMKGHFSRHLREAMEEVMADGRQVILFQNRRGYAPMLLCKTCGWMPKCERCDVALTHHKWKRELNCHHCGFTVDPIPRSCAACGSGTLESKGLGTERGVEELAELFPNARVGRMDLDTTRSGKSYERIVGAFQRRELDILIGTQMISKGLDFAHVGLVGVLSADRMLNQPDFRSFERAYQMLTQVAGRSGRSGMRGKVIIQTFTPDHWVIQKVMANDFEGLIHQELVEREQYNYPPFYRLIRITLKHVDEKRVAAGAEVLAVRLRQRFGDRVNGPETPALSRINLQYIRTLLLKFDRTLKPAHYKALLAQDLMEFGTDDRWKRLRVVTDVDPV